MDKAEAIERLEYLKAKAQIALEQEVSDWIAEDVLGTIEAYDMAIEALQTESNSEKPNNCEDEPQPCEWCKFYDGEKCFSQEPCKVMLYLKVEPTISKMEQVDKDINVRSKWEVPPKVEPQTEITTCVSVPACLLEIEDEPQTERSE